MHMQGSAGLSSLITGAEECRSIADGAMAAQNTELAAFGERFHHSIAQEKVRVPCLRSITWQARMSILISEILLGMSPGWILYFLCYVFVSSWKLACISIMPLVATVIPACCLQEELLHQMEALLSSFAAKKQHEVDQAVHNLRQSNTGAAATLSARSTELHGAAKSAQELLKASEASSTCYFLQRSKIDRFDRYKNCTSDTTCEGLAMSRPSPI